MQRLGFESIDLYLLHRRDYPLEGVRVMLDALEDLVRVGQIHTSGGRSRMQGALGWVWARSPLALPLPGFRNMEQM